MSKTFIRELPSPEAIKLANAIYNTYMKVEEPMMKLSAERVCGLFGMIPSDEAYVYVDRLFDELNEPAVVEDYDFEGKHYDWLLLQFCVYTHTADIKSEFYLVTINPMYIDAIRRFMEKPFIDFDVMER